MERSKAVRVLGQASKVAPPVSISAYGWGIRFFYRLRTASNKKDCPLSLVGPPRDVNPDYLLGL
jgi:hypothetical protein